MEQVQLLKEELLSLVLIFSIINNHLLIIENKAISHQFTHSIEPHFTQIIHNESENV